jgi:hypothetical protein
MKRLNEGANQPKTQDGNYQKHRNKEEKRVLSKKRRQEDKRAKGENEEDSYIIKQLKGIKHDAPAEFVEEFGSDDIGNAMNELKSRAARAGRPLHYELSSVREYLTPRDDFYPESFDNAVNSILKGLQEDVIEEAIPAIVGVVARKAGPHIAAHLAKKGLDRFLDRGEEESYCEDEEDGPSRMQRLQNYIDDKYPTLRPADTFIEDGIDTPAKLEYYLATADYSDTYKAYWGSRPRGFRDRLEENQWDDDDFTKAAERLNDQADEYREKLRLQSPEYRAEKERELKQKYRHEPADGGTSLRDVFSSFSREENEG